MRQGSGIQVRVVSHAMPILVMAWLSFALAAAPQAFARDEGASKEPFRVPRATSAVVVDGIIEERAWDDALTLELDFEVRPGENIKPPVRTVVHITYDDIHLLVAFRAFDQEPEKIRARYRDHDDMRGDDIVGITIDTFNDQRRAYEFMVNPLGVQADGVSSMGQSGSGGSYDRAWDAIWSSAGRITDRGYEVEIAIPFTQIRFQAIEGPQIWGLDCTRSFPRDHDYHIGLFPRDRGANSYLAQEEKIVGFEGISRGRNIEVVPTVTGFALEERADFPPDLTLEKDNDLDLGVTATWGVTPNFTLTSAFNPDFSQIEADAIQLALNETFELFFTEKRPFFLESADYFRTGGNLVYTRMIADPLMAFKFTGKVGRNTAGIIAAYDEVTNLIVPGVNGSDSETFDSANVSLVGRYRYDLGADSSIGALLSQRRGEEGFSSRLSSIDALLRPSNQDSFLVNAAWSNTTYSPEMMETFDLDAKEISGHALTIEYAHTARDWFAVAEYTDRDEDFRADLGFVTRVGYRKGELVGGYTWWGDARNWYNRIEVGGNLEWASDENGGLLDKETQTWFQVQGPFQSFFHLEFVDRTEVYEGSRFENQFTTRFQGRVSPNASFSIRVNGVFGDGVDYTNVQPGDRVRLGVNLDLNFGRHLKWEFSHLYSTLDVSGGRLFEANVPQTTAVWQFNTRAFVRAIIQYEDIWRNRDLYEEEVDAKERSLFAQLLFSYKVNPRTVFFAGYSHGREENQDFDMITTGRSVFLKIGYAWLW